MILGDSNLSRFPAFSNSNLQIDSFPDSHFRHVHALLEKLHPSPNLAVEKVILAFGINSRHNKLKETTMKCTQGAIRTAKKRFPLAEIWIPQINFSPLLPTEEKK